MPTLYWILSFRRILPCRIGLNNPSSHLSEYLIGLRNSYFRESPNPIERRNFQLQKCLTHDKKSMRWGQIFKKKKFSQEENPPLFLCMVICIRGCHEYLGYPSASRVSLRCQTCSACSFGEYYARNFLSWEFWHCVIAYHKTFSFEVTFFAIWNSENPRNSRNSKFWTLWKKSEFCKLTSDDKILNFTNSRHEKFKKLTKRIGR